jgi:hypothetical protein
VILTEEFSLYGKSVTFKNKRSAIDFVNGQELHLFLCGRNRQIVFLHLQTSGWECV